MHGTQHPRVLCENETRTPGRTARVVTWNINGLRKVAASHGGLKQLLDQFNADIVCFQEIKITRTGLVEQDLARAQGYHCFFTHCRLPRKPSYSGVATFVRSESGLKTLASTASLTDAAFFGSPGSFAEGLSPDRLGAIDSEGRVLVTDHGHFVLFNVYAPCISSSDEDEKTEGRRTFKRDFLMTLEARILEVRDGGRGVILVRGRQEMVTRVADVRLVDSRVGYQLNGRIPNTPLRWDVGDLNACTSQQDHGFSITDAEFFASDWSKWIRGMLGLDSASPRRLADCFRHLHPDRKDAFTCWNTQTGARENNYGTRIDYIIADAFFVDRYLEACDIMPSFLGSDHCPVRARFTVPLSSVASMDRGYGEGAIAKNTAGDAPVWPEHPPECSCFYRELTGKQEKLARYFSTSVQRQAPSIENQGQENSATGKAGAGPGGRSLALSSCDDRREFGISAEASLGAAAIFDGADRHRGQGKKVGGAGPASSGRGRSGRGLSWKGPRQSKLMFGPAVSSTLPSGTTEPEASTTRVEAGSRKAGVCASQDVRTDDERGSRVVASTPQMAQASASAGESGRDGREMRGNDTPPVGGVGADSTSSSTWEVEGVDTGSGSGSNGKSSAEAWKVLFATKKSTPPCQHGEPSIQRTVLKQGSNYNRRFYTCARSAGNWPTDRNARCSFFQWRLDGVRGYKDRERDESTKKQRRA